jgi:hypothetical protein
MIIEISSIADAGTFDKERVVLKAGADVDIGAYAAFISDVREGKATSGHKVAYWFPDKKVKAGDLIILYTKAGQDSEKVIAGAQTAHFYYWGLDKPQWGTKKRTLVLLRVSEWIHQIG